MDWLFLILISAVLLFGLMPRSSYLRFEAGTDTFGTATSSNEGEIVSVTGNYNGTEKEGIGNKLSLKGSSSAEDTVTLRSTTQDYTAYFDLGIQNAGGMTTNAQDSEYLSRTTLDAFVQSESIEHPDNPYFKDQTFSELVKQYHNDGYAILFAVKGDSTVGWSDEMEETMRSLGFETTPKSGSEDGSYIGYVYQDEVWSQNGDRSTAAMKTVGGTNFYLSSAGVYSGNNAMIKMNGEELANDENGISVVVYDIANDQLIDSVSYNTNTAEPIMSRADDCFYTEYVTVFRADLLDQAKAYTGVFYWLQAIVCIIAALMLNVLRRDLKKAKRTAEAHQPYKKSYLIWKQVGLSLISVLAAASFAGLSYLLKQFNGVTIDQLLFHMNTNLEGTNWSSFDSLFQELALYCGIALAVSLLWIVLMKKVLLKDTVHVKRSRQAGMAIRWTAVMCGMLALFLVVQTFWNSYYMTDYLAARQFESTLYDDYYVDPANVNITFPSQKKNLIYIYMESMEISAANESVGGGKSFNAIPELTNLALENDDFNGDSDQLNGAIPLYNSTWTIAGMVAQTTGLPLGINHNQTNYSSVSSFMPGATALGDILEEEGYQNVFMLGSKAEFGNRDAYYEEHGDYEIDDYTWAKKNGKLPYSNYYVWWGYEDKKLFEYAQERVTELASDDQPFALTLLTVDTHFTGGYQCEDCPDTFEDQYSNVLACSSKRVAEFVEWVQEQDWGKDTVIILSGDHLCMDSEYYGDMPSGYQRKTYVNIINSQKEEGDTYRTYSTMDMFPTTLSALGCTIPGDRLGFGTDLYSDTPTLLEEKGESYLNYELSLNSSFYNKEILGY